jgi:pyridoxamine 5'-phosphate oxidase
MSMLSTPAPPSIMNLHDTAPGFDQPIAVLKHCHDRIRKQLATLQKLLTHLPRYGADPEAQQAALAVMKYFDKAAPLHHDDEEQDLLPVLRQVATGEDQVTLDQLVPEILAEHHQMEVLWQRLHAQLTRVAAGAAHELSPVDVNEFAGIYGRHMLVEETHIAPMAKRLFDATRMAALGEAMQVRRGIIPTGARVAAMRKDYERAQLSETEVLDDPIAQFEKWFEEALKSAVNEPNAMALSTVGPDGRPSSRIVLVKQFDARGFTWYTNYDSQKGQQLCAQPFAALLFFWRELERQVRVEGKVERTSAGESDTYFHSRPLNSRLAALASQQSQPIESRAELEQHYEQVAAEYGEQPPRPDNWGGFRLVPERIEFWQGRKSRFHDRIVFTRQSDGTWSRQRLQP